MTKENYKKGYFNYNGKKIPSIPTEYHGIIFRSKLEAKWTVDFDLLGISWRYEPEGFQVGNKILYEPDFLIQNVHFDGRPETKDLFVEVKGEFTEEDRIKVREFLNITKHPRCDGNGYFESIERPLLLLNDIPRNFEEACDLKNPGPFLNKVTISGANRPVILGINKQGETILSDCGLECDWNRMLAAFYIARNIRFDHRKSNYDLNCGLIQWGINSGLKDISYYFGVDLNKSSI